MGRRSLGGGVTWGAVWLTGLASAPSPPQPSSLSKAQVTGFAVSLWVSGSPHQRSLTSSHPFCFPCHSQGASRPPDSMGCSPLSGGSCPGPLLCPPAEHGPAGLALAPLDHKPPSVPVLSKPHARGWCPGSSQQTCALTEPNNRAEPVVPGKALRGGDRGLCHQWARGTRGAQACLARAHGHLPEGHRRSGDASSLPGGGPGGPRGGSGQRCLSAALGKGPHSVNVICPKTTFCHPNGCPSRPQNLVRPFVPLTPWSRRVTSCRPGGHWADNSLAHPLSPQPGQSLGGGPPCGAAA